MNKHWIPASAGMTYDDPREAEILRAFVLKRPREYLLAHPETEFSFWQKIHFQRLLKKRARGIPLAYLIRHKEFFGLDFLVNRHTLVPRPETEILVEHVIHKIENSHNKIHKTVLIDIGTGTGCIPIAIAKNIASENVSFFATDISKKALQVAKENAKKHNVDIKFFHGNLLEPVLNNYSFQQSDIIITANLPYLTEKEFAEEASIQSEPKIALVADENGLELYRKLLQQCVDLIRHTAIAGPDTKNLNLFFEINPHQTEAIKKMIREYFSNSEITIAPDLAGRDRTAIIEIRREKNEK